MKLITYLSIITLTVGLVLGVIAIQEDHFGATITTLLTTDQVSDLPAIYNADLASLNNAIHWSAGSDYLYTSSSPTFGLILGDTSSSTIGKLKISDDLNVIGNASTTFLYISDSLTIGAYYLPNTDGNANQILKTDGSGAVTWQSEVGGSSAWEYNSGTDAMVTTSTLGIYITASSSFGGGLNIDGVTISGLGATATGTAFTALTFGKTSLADYWHSHEIMTSYLVDNTTATSTGAEATIGSFTIKGGDMGANGLVRLTMSGLSFTNDTHYISALFGGETIATTTHIKTGSQENRYWHGTVNIYNRGSENLQWAVMNIWHEYGSTGDQTYLSTSTELHIDTSVDQVIDIKAKADSTTDTSLRAADVQIFRKD